jgi:hypothetical protein
MAVGLTTAFLSPIKTHPNPAQGRLQMAVNQLLRFLLPTTSTT